MKINMFITYIAIAITPNLSTADTLSQASNWCGEAKKHLTDTKGRPLSCESIAQRCIKLNNYWCTKNSQKDPWLGAIDKKTARAIEDRGHHAVFENADWSARAIAIDMRSKYSKNKMKTATEIAAAYSPWCDTNGSDPVHEGHGRSCSDDPKPPPTFSGPYCKTPTTPTPSKSDCLPGCNCPPEVAEILVKGMKVGINDDLMLFDSKNRSGPNLSILIKNLAKKENSVIVSDKLIERGIKLLDE